MSAASRSFICRSRRLKLIILICGTLTNHDILQYPSSIFFLSIDQEVRFHILSLKPRYGSVNSQYSKVFGLRFSVKTLMSVNK